MSDRLLKPGVPRHPLSSGCFLPALSLIAPSPSPGETPGAVGAVAGWVLPACMDLSLLFLQGSAWTWSLSSASRLSYLSVCLFISLFIFFPQNMLILSVKRRRMAASQPPCAVPLAWVLGAEPSPGWFSPFHQQKTPYLFFLFFLLYQFSAYLLSWMNSAAAGGCGLGGRAPFSAPPLLQPHPYLVAE